MKTPMMSQYDEMKRNNPGAILLFRMGDFYETFREDAVTVSRVLGLTLTSRSKGGPTGDGIPLAGFPWHALDGYLARLLKAGFRVAVCEQMEDPASAKGILVSREVIEVVTPGTLISGPGLEDRKTLLLCAAVVTGESGGLAFCDLSTGELEATELPAALLPGEVARKAPRELLAVEGLGLEPPPGCELTPLEAWKFDKDSAASRIESTLGISGPQGLGMEPDSPAAAALGALLSYLEDTKRSTLAHLTFCGMYRRDDCLIIDRGSARALAVTEAPQGEESAVLADHTDGTWTAAGSREWRKWLSAPSRDRSVIRARHDAVEWLAGRRDLLRALEERLPMTADLQRQAGRLGTLRSAPRDLRAVARTLSELPAIFSAFGGDAPLLLLDLASADPLSDVVETIDAILADSPPARISDGGVIRTGVSDELDELREIRSGGRSWITSREERERAATGISNLSIGFNRVFGYYIEVSKSHLEKVPAHYIRKQTLVNAERYITPELKEVESRVLRAAEEIEKIETELFAALRQGVAVHSHRLRETGLALARIDVLAGLARIASERGYSRPGVLDSPGIHIVDGRHPVLERTLPGGECVPNSLRLDPSRRILLVTGPNMAGKSTYLRQAALLVIMAQAGSFVPATSMSFSPLDRIFTRIGSSDRITRGQSTFLVEMAEAAALLNSSTEDSLAVLDEVGRGTSTYDGLSLAWAMVEYLHDHAVHRPMVLFATHYHELTVLGSLLPAVANVNAAVRETGKKVLFLYRVEDGSADQSYGIHVASMAGVPGQVVRRARKVLSDLEAGRHLMPGGSFAENQLELELCEPHQTPDHPALQELRGVDPDSLSPKRALEILYQLRDLLD
jgi:DNA mismatch repair protein MutS